MPLNPKRSSMEYYIVKCQELRLKAACLARSSGSTICYCVTSDRLHKGVFCKMRIGSNTFPTCLLNINIYIYIFIYLLTNIYTNVYILICIFTCHIISTQSACSGWRSFYFAKGKWVDIGVNFIWVEPLGPPLHWGFVSFRIYSRLGWPCLSFFFEGLVLKFIPVRWKEARKVSFSWKAASLRTTWAKGARVLAVSQLLIKSTLLITCWVLGTGAGAMEGVQTKLEMRFPPPRNM